MSLSCAVVRGLGGWNLRVDTPSCPDNFPVNCGFGLQTRCCPSGFTCAGDDSNICCPIGSNCASTIDNLALCADPSWTLFQKPGVISSSNGAWCCESNYVGLYTDAGVVCLPVGSVPSGVSLAISTTQTSTCSTSATRQSFSSSHVTASASSSMTLRSSSAGITTSILNSVSSTSTSASVSPTFSPPSPATSTQSTQAVTSSGPTQSHTSSSASSYSNSRNGIFSTGNLVIILGIALGTISWTS